MLFAAAAFAAAGLGMGTADAGLTALFGLVDVQRCTAKNYQQNQNYENIHGFYSSIHWV